MIDYSKINHSIEHYEKLGFKRVESPWTVTLGISDITCPPGGKNFTIAEKNKVLVASGEQSFLAMYNKGFLPKGKFQTVTPCFRDETFDDSHTKYFIKNELIVTDKVDDLNLKLTINAAYTFFSHYLPIGRLEIVKQTDNSTDIMFDGMEVGSYGIRKCSFLEWIYATGCAEPRLSRTIKKYGLS